MKNNKYEILQKYIIFSTEQVNETIKNNKNGILKNKSDTH